MLALPFVSAVALEVKPPPERVTVPVGDGVPLRVTVTVSDWTVVMLIDEGVTVTVGVVFAGTETVT